MSGGTYSFLDVLATIAGPGGSFPLGSGADADKEGISIAFTEDKNKQDSGADGAVMNSLRATKVGTVTARLQKTSPVNAMLSAMYNLQTGSSALHGKNVIVVTDIVRGDLYSCDQVAFRKFPDNMYSEDANRIEWTFDAKITPMLGTGSPSIG